jgi:hypothetical protein
MGNPKPVRNWTPSLFRKVAGGGLFGALLRRLIAAVVVSGLILAGWTYAWRTWGEPATAGKDFVVTTESINVTPPPTWIHADVKAEVVKNGNLSSLRLRDPQLVDRVSRAFAAHSWVASVKKVSKHYPAGVDAELEYRRPVAMVEVTWQGQPKLYFIDAASVLLPSEDFEKEVEQKAPHFLRIYADDVSPTGRAFGTPWGSERIAGAALLAQAWEDRWQKLGLYRLLLAKDDPNGKQMYFLETKAGTRVLWGHAPGSESKGEQTPREKIAWLEQYVIKHGPLDKSAADPNDGLDLQTPTGKTPKQTARKGNGTKR